MGLEANQRGRSITEVELRGVYLYCDIMVGSKTLRDNKLRFQ